MHSFIRSFTDTLTPLDVRQEVRFGGQVRDGGAGIGGRALLPRVVTPAVLCVLRGVSVGLIGVKT